MESIVDREPSQRRRRTFGPGCLRTLRRQHEPQVGVLVRRFAVVRRHGHHDDVTQRRIRPRLEVGQSVSSRPSRRTTASGSRSPGSPWPPICNQACCRSCHRSSTRLDGGWTTSADAVTCRGMRRSQGEPAATNWRIRRNHQPPRPWARISAVAHSGSHHHRDLPPSACLADRQPLNARRSRTSGPRETAADPDPCPFVGCRWCRVRADHPARRRRSRRGRLGQRTPGRRGRSPLSIPIRRGRRSSMIWPAASAAHWETVFSSSSTSARRASPTFPPSRSSTSTSRS